MFFRQIIHEHSSCLSYLIGCQTSGVCAVIDPQGYPDLYLAPVKTNGMQISHVIDTHDHFDHVSTARELASITGAVTFCGIRKDRSDYQVLFDNQIIEIGNRKLRVLHTPGHTPEHICLLGDDWYLLTGDSLFVGDVGRIDLANEQSQSEKVERADQFFHSLQKLLLLPDWIEIYPAHFSGSICGKDIDGKMVSTIGRERRKNPALQMTKEEFIHYQLADSQ